MVKRWKCEICGRVFEGENPPAPCPVCGAGESAFTCLDAPKAVKWRCEVCLQVFEGDQPPVPCPVCGAGVDAFVPVAEEQGAYKRDAYENIVIIGGGVAGLEAARSVRERNSLAAIAVICGEGRPPYNRPALSDVVADGYSFAAIELEDADFYGKNRITLIMDARAERVDTAAHTVHLSDGRELRYDKLCLATGASAFNPVKEEAGSVPCTVLRTYDDALRVMEYASGGNRAVIVGGGILGIEAAAALRERGCRVTVLELSGGLLSLQADEETSEHIRSALESAGIHVITGLSVASVDASGAQLTDGSRIDADFILASAGIRSDTRLARDMGLLTNRGVAVDEWMRTSMENVFAAGDCAQVNGKVAGLWSAAAAQGQAAGASMAGDDSAPYMEAVPATSFEGLGVKLFSAGRVRGKSLSVMSFKEPYGSYKKLFFEKGALCGAVFFGDAGKSAGAISLIRQGAGVLAAAELLA